MKRRKFITLLGCRGGVAACGACAAGRAHAAHRRAHEPGRERYGRAGPRRSVLARVAAIGLERSAATCKSIPAGPPAMPSDVRKYAAELVALAPDVILSTAPQPWRHCYRRPAPCQSCSLVVADPVGAGFVDSLARPGGNATGFISFEYGLSAKWLELLKEIAPGMTRAAVLRDPAITAGIGQFAAIQTAAPSLGVEVSPVNVRDAGEIERAITAFARSGNGGLIVTGSPLTALHRDLIVTLAARHKLPAVYYERSYVTGGGLISYGPDFLDQYRRAAGYIDRILKGEKPADLPVQAATKYELVINLKTAKALGLEVPPTLLARADEVIE